ncbi:sugar transferase [Streptomyces sp. NPDC101165]|uniref:sugar transferase n=1 Tax=Streptomyces sp. NPDC101165 TaxID=3366119 RepID=UPI00381A42DF
MARKPIFPVLCCQFPTNGRGCHAHQAGCRCGRQPDPHAAVSPSGVGCLQILKFRTMHAGADKNKAALLARNEANGHLFKLRDDPRITPVGRLLRRLSLDELPQLVNVL